MFKKKYYRSPGGTYYKLFEHMLNQHHLLVAGATGSGKSVVINGMIYTALLHTPDQYRFILIDTKRVELVGYRNVPHTITYASSPEEAVTALKVAVNLIELRYQEMQRQQVRMYSGADVYVVIDELADLMTTCKREVTPLLQRICMIGRAARVHLVAGTQRPTADIIPASITVNVDSRLGLHTRNAQDSRNIIYQNGCEMLPAYGQGYYSTPEGLKLYNIPRYDDMQINDLIAYWTDNRRCMIAA